MPRTVDLLVPVKALSDRLYDAIHEASKIHDELERLIEAIVREESGSEALTAFMGRVDEAKAT